MLKTLSVTLAALMLSFQLSACTSMTGESLGQNIDDTTITTTVKSKLALQKASSLTRIGVDTVKGVVHLTGIVENPELKQRAESVARGVAGVRDVVNNLQVQTR